MSPATIGPSAYWYLTRSTGWVSLLLLTATVLLGVIEVNRFSTAGWPRFVVHGLHRYVSLLVLVFLALHILTAALDSFATISLLDAVVPFLGSYRPIWLGLGAVSFDLLLALAITSLIRRRVGYRAWRLVHWLAYACWPIALVHSLGTGSDVKSVWSLTLTALCVLAVTAAVGVRALRGWPVHARLRAGALALATLGAVALTLWLPGGPLGHGWARRAGTPPSLLAGGARLTSASPPSAGVGRTPGSGTEPFGRGFTANLSGTVSQSPGSAPGQVAVRIRTSFTATVTGQLEIEIDGQASPEGGVSMRRSSVTLGSPLAPVSYRGSIVALDGSRLSAEVSDAKGRRLSLQVALAVNAEAGTVTGTLLASPLNR
jgi:hypothetical protein